MRVVRLMPTIGRDPGRGAHRIKLQSWLTDEEDRLLTAIAEHLHLDRAGVLRMLIVTEARRLGVAAGEDGADQSGPA